IHDIKRFAGEGEFLSYARLIRPLKTSAGKVTGGGGGKIGNAHLKWAFSEAVPVGPRERPGQALSGPQGEEARQAQGPGHPGGAAGSGRLSHAAAAAGLRPETLLERRAQGNASPSQEVHREGATSRRRIPVRFAGMNSGDRCGKKKLRR